MQIPGYRDLEVLGRGGFSTVYSALQESVQRHVALKVLAVHMAGADAQLRFRRECATNGRVGNHPNIVTLFDSGFADDGSPYLAMQLCTGGSLSDRLRASGALPVADVLRIGVKISAALQYAHSAGVLHRDIKPENILISDFGEPELADFGISSVDDQRMSTVTASSFTISHAAPEALAGQPSSVSTDVYSLCSTLFTLVAGHTPFAAPSSTALGALVNMVMNEPAPRTGRADVPEALERLLAEGLSKTPAGRPVDAKALGSRLQQIQQSVGLPVTEFPSAPPPITVSPTQIFEGGMGAGGVAGALGVAGAVGVAGAIGAAAGAPGALGPGFGTGALTPTGAMPGGGVAGPTINTGALPPTGAMAPPTSGPVVGGQVPGGPGDPPRRPTIDTGARPGTGQWGNWANGVGAAGGIGAGAVGAGGMRPGGTGPGAGGQPILGPADDGHFHPVVREQYNERVVSGPPNRPSPSSRRTWMWIAAAAVLVLLIGVGVYFVAIKGTSSSANTTTPPVSSARSTASKSPARTSSSKATTTKASTSAPPTTKSTPTKTTPTTPSTTKAADVTPVIDSFGSSSMPDGSSVSCSSASASVNIPLVWNSSGGKEAWIAIDSATGDASKDPTSIVDPVMPSDYPLEYVCSAPSHTYTLTVASASGQKTSKSVTFTTDVTETSTSQTSTSDTTTTSPTTTTPPATSPSPTPTTPTTPTTASTAATS